MGKAIEALLPPTPPPESPSCAGCAAVAGTQAVTYNGTGAPQNGATTSAYTLDFSGSCAIKASLGGSLPMTGRQASI